jgi:hypothetical protein
LLASTTKFLEARVYDWSQEEEEKEEAAEGQPLEVTAGSGDIQTEVLRTLLSNSIKTFPDILFVRHSPGPE